MNDVNRQTTKPGLRTFARDLEAVRQARGLVAKTANTTVSEMPKTAAVIEPGTIPTRPTAPSISATTPAPATKKTTTPLPSTEEGPIKITATSDRDASYEATIITDNKHKRFQLGPALADAVAGWFKEKTTSKSKKPTYTVPPVERRKGVVEQAATMTARGATQDHHEIVARLRAERSGGLPTVPPVPVTAKPVIEPRPTTPPPGPTFAVLETAEPVTKASTTLTTTPSPTPPKPVPEEPAGLPELIITEPTPAQRILPIIPEFPPEPMEPNVSVPFEEIKEATDEFYEGVYSSDADLEAAPEEYSEPEEVPPEEPDPIPVITPVSFPKITPAIPQNQSTQDEMRAPQESISVVTDGETPRRRLGNKDSLEARKAALTKEALNNPKPLKPTTPLVNWLPIGLVSLVVFATIGGVAYIFLGASPTIDTPEVVTTTTPGLPPIIPTTGLTGQTAIPAVVLQSDTRFALYTALATAKDPSLTSQFITPLKAETTTALNTREILDLINRQLVADFVAVVGDIRLGYQTGAPAIVMRVSDMTIARGGMFAWERTLGTDLSPWFQNGADTRTSVYTDISIADIDVRRLADSTGKTVLVYGMKNNTVIITSDEATFAELATLYIPQW